MEKRCLELTWLSYILQNLRISNVNPTKLFCDNQVVLHIAMDTSPSYVPTQLQLANIFTKALGKDQFVTLCNKLGIHHDIHFPI